MALTTCYRLAGGYRLYYASYSEGSADDFPAWNANYYIGTTGEEGMRLNRDILLQEITADQTGKAIIDDVHQGSNMELEFVAQDYNRASVTKLLYPWQTTTNDTTPTTDVGLYGIPGKLAAGVAGTLWAFPIVGTPACLLDQGGATTTANAMQFKGIHVGPVPVSLDTTPRFVPVRFRCYPFISSGIVRQFNWITNSVEASVPFAF